MLGTATTATRRNRSSLLHLTAKIGDTFRRKGRKADHVVHSVYPPVRLTLTSSKKVGWLLFSSVRPPINLTGTEISSYVECQSTACLDGL